MMETSSDDGITEYDVIHIVKAIIMNENLQIEKKIEFERCSCRIEISMNECLKMINIIDADVILSMIELVNLEYLLTVNLQVNMNKTFYSLDNIKNLSGLAVIPL